MIRKFLTRTDGLPSNTVRSIVCDKQGLFWIVTEKGICRYDGRKIYPLPLPRSSNQEQNLAILEQTMTVCAVDSIGTLWVGTRSGVLRFFPQTGRWKWFLTKHTNSATINQIAGIHCDQRGQIWIPSLGGLLRYDGSKDSCILAFPERIKENIGGISESKDGRLWFAVGKNTLATYNPSTKKLHTSTPQGCEGGLYLHTVSHGEGVWISPISPISQAMESPRLVSYDATQDAYHVSAARISASAESLRGIDIYLGAEDDNNGWYSMVHDYAAGRCENGLYRIQQRREGNILSSPSDIANERNTNPFQELLVRGKILGFCRSPRSGVICAGVAGQGLAVLIPTGMERLANKASMGEAISLLADKRGRYWCGTEQGLFLRSQGSKDGTVWRKIDFAQRPQTQGNSLTTKTPVYEIQETSTGKILVGTVEGLYFFNETNEKLYPFPALTAQLGATTVRRITPDPMSTEFWVYAPSAGVIRCREDGAPLAFFPVGQPSSASDSTSLGASDILTMQFDERGDLWIGGSGVLLRQRRESGTLERMTVLPESQLTLIAKKLVFSTKHILLGTFFGAGLGIVNTLTARLDNAAVQKFMNLAAINKRLSDVQIVGLASVGKMLWWTTKSHGVYHAPYSVSDAGVLEISHPSLLLPSEDNSLAKGNSADAGTQQADQGWNVGALTPDGEGGVLFDYYGDVLHANHRQARVFTDTARVLTMEWLRNDSLMVSIPQHGDTLHCAYSGSFQILCSMVSMIRPERHHLEYRLEGVDKDWNTMPESDIRTLRYSSLPPGKYTLWVRTRAQDPWDDEPLYSANILTLNVHVPYPWWLHPVTQGIATVLFAGGFAWIGFSVQHRRNERRLRALEKEKEYETLRRETVEAQMQTLRLQMNPHFMYNVLAEIQRLVEIKDSSSASHYIGVFSRLLRRIVRQAGKEYITVSDEISILRQYMDLEELRNEGRLKCYITLHANISDEEGDDSSVDYDNHEEEYWYQREIPTFILQPFVENAIRHGIRGLEEQDWQTRQMGIISISILEEEGTLRCIIEDNGVGREEAARRKAARQRKDNLSIATTVTQERLNLMKSTYGQEFPVIYNDLYDEEGKGAGTQVTVILPCRLRTQEELIAPQPSPTGQTELLRT